MKRAIEKNRHIKIIVCKNIQLWNSWSDKQKRNFNP